MILRLYTPLFALTLLLSAILLFSVQPMFSKMILPLLGGTPQVWNTAMVFFQITLLAGYAYAHGSSRFLSVRAQAVVHIILLVICSFVLPIAIPEGWIPPTEADPTLWQLSLMAISVGGPFFVLSASAPMLQRWFAATDHPDADNPYFLYGASNLGSMGALLAYPFIIEPLMYIGFQSSSWSIGYTALIALIVLAFVCVYKSAAKHTSTKEDDGKADISWLTRLRWIFLAFVPSSMMLGVTTYITTDIASAPLLWILPLSLYVGTFILVFSRKELITAETASILFLFFIALMFFQTVAVKSSLSNPFIIVGLHFLLFFSSALLCHKELANSRPHPSRLTEFYLLMSFGGALGGIFNAQIAPNLFVLPIEYAAVIGLVGFVRFSTKEEHSLQKLLEFYREIIQSRDILKILDGNGTFVAIIIACAIFAFYSPGTLIIYVFNFIIFICLICLITSRWAAAFSILLLITLFPPGYVWNSNQLSQLYQSRNYFGVLRVVDDKNSERFLMHGTTNHGAQALDPQFKMEPLSYYSVQSPIRDVYDSISSNRLPQEIGIVGLGVGVTACFQKDGRSYDFFEINPEIVKIAEDEELFTYLSDCGSPYEIVMGDGRLTMQDKPDKLYDIILMDAFSSDSIPIHLLTLEAVELYLTKLKDDGVLVFNATNRHVDLEPVLSAIGQELGVAVFGKVGDSGRLKNSNLNYYPTHFVAFTKSYKNAQTLEESGWSEGRTRDGVKLWTDQYSNILSVFIPRITGERFKEMALRKKAAAEEEATLSP